MYSSLFPNNCTEKVTNRPNLLVIEVDTGFCSYLTTRFSIEQEMTIFGVDYSLLGALRIDGSHTTGYYLNHGQLMLYDGLKNNGEAVLLACKSFDDLSTNDFKWLSHFIYVRNQPDMGMKYSH